MSTEQECILALNFVAHRIDFGLFSAAQQRVSRLFFGKLAGLNSISAYLLISDTIRSITKSQTLGLIDERMAIATITEWLKGISQHYKIVAVSHGLIFGGHIFYEPQAVNTDSLQRLRKLSVGREDYLPKQIDLIEELQKLLPSTPQFMCFETAFFNSMPAESSMLPIPYHYFQKGVRRYGFHGLSCESVMEQLAELDGHYIANSQTVLVYLDDRMAVTAIRDGKCVDTSTGFTLCSGVPTDSCVGHIDAELAFYFAAAEGMTMLDFNHMVTQESGLKGLFGYAGDFQDLLGRRMYDNHSDNPLEYFCRQISKWICSMAASMSGIKTLLFCGEYAEQSAYLREQICVPLAFIGVTLDMEKNLSHRPIISPPQSQVLVRVIRSDTETVLAQHALHALQRNRSVSSFSE